MTTPEPDHVLDPKPSPSVPSTDGTPVTSSAAEPAVPDSGSPPGLSSDSGTPVAAVAPVAVDPVAPAAVPEKPTVADAPVAAVGAALAVVGSSAASEVLPKLLPASVPASGRATAHSGRIAALASCDFRLGTSRKLNKHCIVHHLGGFQEVLLIKSPECDAFIRSQLRAKGQMAKERDLKDINDELISMAQDIGEALDLYVRVAPMSSGGIEIDLHDGQGTTVCIDAAGVQVTEKTSATMFLHPSTMLPLPRPALAGDYMLMRRYVQLDALTFTLYIGWVTYTIAHPKLDHTKYVFLVFKGTQGSGKSFASKHTQKLVDPSTTGAQTLPKDARGLAIMTQLAHLLVVDNLRDITPAMSDALCIAATGGTLAWRQLYSDDAQKNLFLHGAILFNGIHPFIGQSDFADRCLVLHLDAMVASKRRSEAELAEQFEQDYPVILGALYDLISKIFRHLPNVKVESPSRMVDFCRWLAAMELAIGCPAGSLLDEYDQSIRDMQLESLQDNPLAAAILQFAESMTDTVWQGTPAEFYRQLELLVAFTFRKSAGWPVDAPVMSKRLRGLQAPLLSQGVQIELSRGKDRQVTVTIPADRVAKPQKAGVGGVGSVGKSVPSPGESDY